MVERKRGYVKWTDENGVRHKVAEAEYDAMVELNEELPEEPVEGPESH